MSKRDFSNAFMDDIRVTMFVSPKSLELMTQGYKVRAVNRLPEQMESVEIHVPPSWISYQSKGSVQTFFHVGKPGSDFVEPEVDDEEEEEDGE